jgi:hypothetical protein
LPVVSLTLTDEQLQSLDARAEAVGMNRRRYMLDVLFALDRPVTADELFQMVSAKAREGNMRAIEILARKQPVSPKPDADEQSAVDEDDPFAEVDQLAQRRASGG